jgi:hypothetical protein
VENTLQSNLAEWNRAFGEYAKVTSKQPQEALEHKVKALGIALWKGFTVHQFGGTPRQRSVGMLQLAARTAASQGTRIRSTLMAEYMANRAIFRAKAKAIKQSLRNFGGTLDQWSGLSSALDDNREDRIGLWQSIVGREVQARQSGIGQLGAAFLWYRRRGKGENKRLVVNRGGKPMGGVEVSEGQAIITGRVEGLTTVDARYGVVAQAIADETADTMKYIKEKQDAEAAKLVRKLVA